MNQVGEAYPTLPQLFDLIDSPSYANANAKKPTLYQPQRPSTTATQNRTASTPSSINKRRKKPAQVTTASTMDNFMKTESTFYSPTTNTSFQYEPYCFSELKTIKRPLKKLYSSRQYESLNRKRDDLKDKYSNLYANPNIKREELSPEKFQELYLGAEQMFNTSYSIKYMGLMDDKLGVVSQRVPMNKSLVTQYFLPKKLQSVKKKDNDISQASNTMGRWHVADKSQEEKTPKTEEDLNKTANKEVSWIVESPEQRRKIWQKVTVADQKKENTADFTRKVESMSKVKNSLLRNVRMEKAWMAKGIKDDLDVLEKSRTFELRNVMANSAKYSYSKLLKTMRTKERPETSLIENTQKREKILATRDEKKRMMQSQDIDNVGEIDTRDHGNNYVVKIQYPKENKMLNRFIKIRENIEA